MRSKFRLFLFTLSLAALFLGACSSSDTVIGQPTILDERGPVALICDIQKKFKAIPKPLFSQVNYYKPWKEWKLAAGTDHWSESFDVVLTEEAYAFVQEHSAIEINIALLPLIVDPEEGADVLALFDGMRAKGKKAAHSPRVPTYLIGKYKQFKPVQKYLSDYSRYHKTQHSTKFPTANRTLDDIQWDEKLRQSFLLKQNTFYPIYLPNYQSVKGTLEHEILEILRSYRDAERDAPASDWRRHKDWTTRPTLEIKTSDKFSDILAKKPSYLDMGINLKNFIANNNERLTALVLLSVSDLYTLGILENLHHKYWLAYTTTWHKKSLDRQKEGRRYQQKMQREIINKATSFCN